MLFPGLTGESSKQLDFKRQKATGSHVILGLDLGTSVRMISLRFLWSMILLYSPQIQAAAIR